MTHQLQVGSTTIPYQVRFSPRARKKRIVVRPEGVVVVAPEGTPLEGKNGVRAFVKNKRRWLFDARRNIAARHQKLLSQQWASGAKLQYRGRWLLLEVEPAAVDQVEITCRSRFYIKTPQGLSSIARPQAIGSAMEAWLRTRAERDLLRFARRHQTTLGVQATGVRLSAQKHAWGTCGRDRILRVHWRLIQAPAAAMEYVVAHEVCHLLHRNHSATFWATLASTLPEWEMGKQLLERWEVEHRTV